MRVGAARLVACWRPRSVRWKIWAADRSASCGLGPMIRHPNYEVGPEFVAAVPDGPIPPTNTSSRPQHGPTTPRSISLALYRGPAAAQRHRSHRGCGHAAPMGEPAGILQLSRARRHRASPTTAGHVNADRGSRAIRSLDVASVLTLRIPSGSGDPGLRRPDTSNGHTDIKKTVGQR